MTATDARVRPEPTPPVQLCAFRLGAEEYAIDVMRLEEVLRPQPITPIAGAPAFVKGVVNLRGAVIPVIDAHARVGAGAPLPGGKPRLIVCRVGRGRVALQVDAITGIVRARREDLRPAPVRDEAPDGSPLVLGVWGPPERMRLLLNVKALITGGKAEAGR